MTSSIITTNEDTYFYSYNCNLLYIHYFSVIKSLSEFKLLVDLI